MVQQVLRWWLQRLVWGSVVRRPLRPLPLACLVLWGSHAPFPAETGPLGVRASNKFLACLRHLLVPVDSALVQAVAPLLQAVAPSLLCGSPCCLMTPLMVAALLPPSETRQPWSFA